MFFPQYGITNISVRKDDLFQPFHHMWYVFCILCNEEIKEVTSEPALTAKSKSVLACDS